MPISQTCTSKHGAYSASAEPSDFSPRPLFSLLPRLPQVLFHLQLRMLDPSPRLIKPKLLPRPQTLLQRTTNLDRLHSARELKRQRLIIQTALSELIRLDHKRLLKAAIIVRRDLAPNPRGLAQLHQIHDRIHINADLPLSANDFRHVVLTRRHHAGRVKTRNLAAPELDDADAIVDVAVLAQVGLHGGDAEGGDRLDD